MTSSTTSGTVPNHHAGHPGFAGATGALAGLTMLLGNGAVARLAASLTDVGPADRVVDVGCGPGGAARVAARRGAIVHGVDPAPVMLALARWCTRRRPGPTWVEGTAEALPLPDGSATVQWALATMHHWEDLDRALTEAFRVLRPGGRFLALERRVRPGARGLGSHGWTGAQAEAAADRCRAAGFVEVRVRACRARVWTQLGVQALRPGPNGMGGPVRAG